MEEGAKVAVVLRKTRRRFRWSVNLLASKILSYAVTCTPERARAPQLLRVHHSFWKIVGSGKPFPCCSSCLPDLDLYSVQRHSSRRNAIEPAP